MKFTVNFIRKNDIVFSIYITIITIIAIVITKQIGPDTIWFKWHLHDGNLLLNGMIPAIPTFPMWGYPILSSLFSENVIVFQGIFLVIICYFWYLSLSLIIDEKTSPKLIKLIVNPIILTILLSPFIFLTVSYYSSSLFALLIFAGVWLLYVGILYTNKLKIIGFSGLLIGLSYYIRSESFIIGLLLFSAILIYGIRTKSLKLIFLRAMVFITVIIIVILPWIIYTKITVGKPITFTSNGGAVMYSNLGVVPNNPWNIYDNSDKLISIIAEENNLGTAWSYEADSYFKQQYFKSIKDYPYFFLKRVTTGWRQMLTQGLYLPPFRKLLKNHDDIILIDNFNEKIKSIFGLNVNTLELQSYQSMGISMKDYGLKHYAIIFLDICFRFIFLFLFLSLTIYSVTKSIKLRFNNFISLLFTLFFIYLLIISGFIQTLPRHTTTILPILISATILLLQSSNPGLKNKL